MFYGWINVLVIWIFYVLVTVPAYYGFGSYVGPMAKGMHMTMGQASLGFTFYNFAMALSMPLAATLINKLGTKRTLFIGALMCAISNIAMATVVNNVYIYWIVFGVIFGIGSALSTQLPIRNLVSFWFTRKRATAMSLAFTAGGIGSLIFAPLVAKIVAGSSSWHTVFYTLTIASAIGGIILWLFVRNKPSDMGLLPDGDKPGDAMQQATVAAKQSRVYKNPSPWEASSAYKTPAFWLVLVCAFAMFYAVSCIISLAVPHFVNVGIPKIVAASAIGLFGLINIGSRLLSGFLCDIIEPRLVLAIGFIFQIIAAILLITARTEPMAYLFAICYAMAFGLIYICLPNIIVNYFGVKNFATINGRLLLIATLIGGTSPFISGSIFDATKSYNTAWMIVLALSVISFVCALLATAPKTKTS